MIQVEETTVEMKYEELLAATTEFFVSCDEWSRVFVMNDTLQLAKDESFRATAARFAHAEQRLRELSKKYENH